METRAMRVIPANLDLKTLENMVMKIKKIQKLKLRRSFWGYFQTKCSFELARILDYYAVAGGARMDYYHILHYFVRLVYRLEGWSIDEIFARVIGVFKKKSQGRIKYDERVLEGMKEMVQLMWKYRECIETEFKQMQYLKKLEEQGRKIDWESFSLWELEFAEPKPDEKKEEGGK
jgi:hypothetical protein